MRCALVSVLCVTAAVAAANAQIETSQPLVPKQTLVSINVLPAATAAQYQNLLNGFTARSWVEGMAANTGDIGISPSTGMPYVSGSGPGGHETVLLSFTWADGANPAGGVIRDSAGNLYGTTYQGGINNAGLLYKLDTAGLVTVLYRFTGGPDWGGPTAGVILDSAANLYGTTSTGGTAGGGGVVYKLDTKGHESVLYSFTGGADGGYPNAVIRDSAGNFYGTTYYGGTAGAGVVYKLDTTGKETVLYSFTGGVDGGSPYAGVIGDSVGNLYGTTYGGGTKSGGVVFKIKP